MKRIVLSFVPAFALLAVHVACSSSDTTPASSANDGGASSSSSSSSSSGSDSSSSSSSGGDASKEDVVTPAGETSIAATINGVSKTLVRSQFGNTSNDAGASLLYIESHEGGDPACPTQNSPSPNRTMIINGVPRGKAGDKYTLAADGIAISYLDFKGDQITDGKPFVKATSATITIVAIDGNKSAELDVDVTFAEGSAKGHLNAGFCDSLSD